ncbi:hypothetical protein Tco_0005237 [Tanacetum coccineum]
MWMYATISPKLVDMILDSSATASGLWTRLQEIFHDNKDARVIQLENKIRNIQQGRSYQFDTTRSMLLLEESVVSKLEQASHIHNSSHTVLVAANTGYDRS